MIISQLSVLSANTNLIWQQSYKTTLATKLVHIYKDKTDIQEKNDAIQKIPL